jgi:Big-like domain-containing protein
VNRCRALGVVVLTAACGGVNTTPTTTSAPTLLTITPATALIIIGRSQTLSAFVVLADGSGHTIQAEWSIDRPTVATIESTGILTGVGPGIAVITAKASGRIATQSVRVLPNYDAVWDGSARVVECTGGDPGVCTPSPCAGLGTCGPTYPLGSVNRLQALISQRDEAVLGFVNGIPSSGTIDEDGTLTLEGVLQERDALGPYEYRVTEWRSRIDAGGGMRGGFVMVRPSFSPRTAPPARVRYEIVTATRAALATTTQPTMRTTVQ